MSLDSIFCFTFCAYAALFWFFCSWDADYKASATRSNIRLVRKGRQYKGEWMHREIGRSFPFPLLWLISLSISLSLRVNAQCCLAFICGQGKFNRTVLIYRDIEHGGVTVWIRDLIYGSEHIFTHLHRLNVYRNGPYTYILLPPDNLYFCIELFRYGIVVSITLLHALD